MALKSFLKRVFSFGSKQVEEKPDDDAPDAVPALPPAEAAESAPSPVTGTSDAEALAAAEAAARAEAEAARQREAEEAAEKRAREEAAERARAREEELARLKAAEEEARRRAEKRAAEKAQAEAEAAAKARAEADAADAARREAENADRRAREQNEAAEKARAEAEAAEKARAEAVAEEEARAKAEADAKVERERAGAEARRVREAEERQREAEALAARQAAERDAATEAGTPSVPLEPSEPAGKGKVSVGKDVAAAPKTVAEAPAEPAPKVGWLQRLRQGLSRSSGELTSKVTGLFTKRKLDEDTLQDLEDILIQSDLGLETAMRITDALSQGRYGKNIGDDEVRAVMAEEIGKVLQPVAMPLELDLDHKPHVILVVGVNGTGKTTTIGKLAAKLRQGGLDVMLAAGDTFRAAAIEQLHIWGDRVGAPVVSTKLGSDAAGLAYDAFEKAKEAGSDVLIIDTAGRLQNKTELMDELAKIVRVLGKLDPEAPHTVLQTLDATTGQNALSQVEIFRNVAGVNGLVMTKLDGTARGGILVAIAAKHKLPVYFVGVGEQVDDLEPFTASEFARAIVGQPEREDAQS